jgi:hypothetical protein
LKPAGKNRYHKRLQRNRGRKRRKKEYARTKKGTLTVSKESLIQKALAPRAFVVAFEDNTGRISA